jgi:hypothetical protein
MKGVEFVNSQDKFLEQFGENTRISGYMECSSDRSKSLGMENPFAASFRKSLIIR